MKILVFDVKGKLAHFRRPDTTATQMSYPFITPTAVKGMVGAIMGIEDFVTQDQVGIQLLNPVITVAQQMSMLGKDGGTTFNRPTTIELVVNPAYRIYYAGDEYGDQLESCLRDDTSVYPTYLGSAFALTKPIYQGVYTGDHYKLSPGEYITLNSIVPTRIVREINFQPDRNYSRAGGFMWTYKGKRTFEKSIDFLYERSGKSIKAQLISDPLRAGVNVVKIGAEYVCLI